MSYFGYVAEDRTKWDKGRKVSQKMAKKVGHPLWMFPYRQAKLRNTVYILSMIPLLYSLSDQEVCK